MKQKGYSLIELLVVIAIIAVLSAVALVSYQNVGKKSRDAQRISDLKEIQKGLEQYYAMNSKYNNTAGENCTSVFSISSIFPQGKPVPPKGASTEYTVWCTAEGGYYAYIALEDVSKNNSGYAGGLCDFGAGIKDRYCVVNLQ